MPRKKSVEEEAKPFLEGFQAEVASMKETAFKNDDDAVKHILLTMATLLNKDKRNFGHILMGYGADFAYK